MGSPCFQLHETGERTLKFEEEGSEPGGNFPRRHYPDRVLGYFLSPIQMEHPCFNNPIETLPARFGKFDGLTLCRAGSKGQPFVRAGLDLPGFEATGQICTFVGQAGRLLAGFDRVPTAGRPRVCRCHASITSSSAVRTATPPPRERNAFFQPKDRVMRATGSPERQSGRPVREAAGIADDSRNLCSRFFQNTGRAGAAGIRTSPPETRASVSRRGPACA